MAATKTAPKPATEDGHSPVEYLQAALDELTKARERASGDIRAGIDSAIERTRDAMKEAGGEAQGAGLGLARLARAGHGRRAP